MMNEKYMSKHFRITHPKTIKGGLDPMENINILTDNLMTNLESMYRPHDIYAYKLVKPLKRDDDEE